MIFEEYFVAKSDPKGLRDWRISTRYPRDSGYREKLMAPRRPTIPPPQAPVLNPLQLRRRIDRLKQCITDLEAFKAESVDKRFNIPEVVTLEASIKDALAAAFGHSTPRYRTYEGAANLDQGPVTMRMGPAFGRGPSIDYDARDAQEARQYLAQGKVRSIQILHGAIRALETDLADLTADEDQPPIPRAARAAEARKVFVVHGHDEGVREAVARFLEKIGFEAVILHEKANQGRTVIEKVEAHGDVGFAVVLLTPDDEGCVKGGTPTPRVRQNVLLELGYFLGKLTRARVCTLKVGDPEIPSDWRGVIDESFDIGGGWRQTLARELQAAGFDVDWNLVMRG
jgi:predicted nucleotide-binding protein